MVQTAMASLEREVRLLLESGVEQRPHPMFPGAVAQVALGGGPGEPVVVGAPIAVGEAIRWRDRDRLLDARLRRPVTDRTLFDLASLTKIFTAVVALRVLAADGRSLDEPVAAVLPAYRVPDKAMITWRHLFTHVSGLPAGSDLWRRHLPPRDARHEILRVPLVTPPGSVHEYSCIGLIVAGLALEELTGQRLDTLVTEEVTVPLGMSGTAYGPRAEAEVAATEDAREFGRGMVCGAVHDETAWAVGGISGNAGIFSTVGDLMTLGLALSDPDGGLLTPQQWQEMTTDQLPPGLAADYGQGIGLRIGDPFLVPPALARWVGHTGFTGTSLVIDPTSGSVGVLLTNRVHPSRTWSDITGTRVRFAELVASAAAGQSPGESSA